MVIRLCVTLILCDLITGSVFKLKRQDNLTDFILDDTETIVAVITGRKTKRSNFSLHCYVLSKQNGAEKKKDHQQGV